MIFVILTFVMMTAEVTAIVHEHHAHKDNGHLSANISANRPKSASWDQENLKSHDNTCATMVYHNNAQGVLVQCP